MPQGEEAAQKAVARDDSLGEAHSSLAAVYLFYRGNWEGADRESARALELDPGRAESHHLRGYILLVLNRTAEALQEQKKAMELDPFARRWELASALIRARRYEAALNEARLRSEAYPSDADLHGFVCMAYSLLGREEEGAQACEAYLWLLG